MANKKKTMGLIRQILRLKKEGTSIRSIAETVKVSRNTVRKYLRLIEARSMELETALSMSDEELSGLIDPPDAKDDDNRYDHLMEQMSYFERELRRTGVSRWLLWSEYKAAYAQGYNYSQFCHHFQQWQQAQEVTMHFEYEAGDKLFVDYTGKKLELIDAQSGEVQSVEVFVAILAASQLTYVEAVRSQSKADFFGPLARCLHFFGGVPRVIIPDNVKAAVIKASSYEPELNPSMEDFAEYYQVAVMPTRAFKPRDKALVENAVRIVYSRIFAPLRKQTFHDLRSLNAAIKEKLAKHHRMQFQGLDYSRRDRFEAIEKKKLKPLPPALYELKEFAKAKVQKNAHVRLGKDKHYYSVPYSYIGKQVKLAYTSDQVEIFYQHSRIAYHVRSYQENRYTTLADHMPSHHRFIAEWSPKKFITWADKIGEDTGAYIRRVLESKTYPEQAYKSCLGILSFAKKVGFKRLNRACRRAHTFQSYGYGVVKNILEKKLDELPLEEEQQQGQLELPLHDNIRGKDYYQ